jgi:hypothetical protein
VDDGVGLKMLRISENAHKDIFSGQMEVDAARDNKPNKGNARDDLLHEATGASERRAGNPLAAEVIDYTQVSDEVSRGAMRAEIILPTREKETYTIPTKPIQRYNAFRKSLGSRISVMTGMNSISPAQGMNRSGLAPMLAANPLLLIAWKLSSMVLFEGQHKGDHGVRPQPYTMIMSAWGVLNKSTSCRWHLH